MRMNFLTDYQVASGGETDDLELSPINESRQGCRLPTDAFDYSTKKGKKAFEDYCKMNSGEVITYNRNDLVAE